MSSWVFLLASLVGLLFTLNAAWPRQGPVMLMPSWLAAFLTIDLPFHHIAWQAASLPAWWWFGSFEEIPGRIGLVILFVSWCGMVLIWLPALKARRQAAMVAEESRLEHSEPVPGSLLLKPFSRTRPGVEVLRDVEFRRVSGRSLKLDVFSPDQAGSKRPALVYVHGGGWVFGDKKDQGLPLCNHLAGLGWVCFNVNYRLSPGATYPDHVVDVKAALAWVREHADEYGVDTGFIAIAGGSAGGHIAAMTALTPGVTELQPGFEQADTSVQAVVPSYGVYDLTNRIGAHNPGFITKMIAPLVVKAFPDEEPERFAAASPMDHVANADQPWLILQGSKDSLAPVTEARKFFGMLESVCSRRVVYAEFPRAEHAFDIYYCHRANAAVELTTRFLITALKES